MDFLKQLTQQAAQCNARILMVESCEPRIQKAAIELQQQGILTPILLGNQTVIERSAEQNGLDVSELTCLEVSAVQAKDYAQRLHALRQHKGLCLEEAAKLVENPLVQANLLLDAGKVDGVVAGAEYTTAEVVRYALQITGTAPNASLVSSFFIMVIPSQDDPSVYLFSDCALVVEPSAEQLISIGQSTIENAKALLNDPVRVALLSFSTNGSAKHPNAEKVAQATAQLRAIYPDHCIDGEIQLDAALVPTIAHKKMPEGQTKGQANVLIFPSLEAGNIGYKLVQQFGQGLAIGPVLQGLNKPINDLSRGCTWEDVFYTATITAIQAK